MKNKRITSNSRSKFPEFSVLVDHEDGTVNTPFESHRFRQIPIEHPPPTLFDAKSAFESVAALTYPNRAHSAKSRLGSFFAAHRNASVPDSTPSPHADLP